MLAGGAGMFLLNYLLVPDVDARSSLVMAVSFTMLFPVMWFFGFMKRGKDKEGTITTKQIKQISMAALLVAAVLLFVLGLTLREWSVLKAGIYALSMPVSVMLIGWLTYLIFRPDKSLK